MIIIACLDGRQVAYTKFFRDTLTRGQKITHERITVQHRAILVAERLQRIVITNELVGGWCNFFDNVLTNMRCQQQVLCTIDQVIYNIQLTI